MIQKIERLLDLMIAHYEKADNPVCVVGRALEDGQYAAGDPPVAPAKKERKPRAPKAEKSVEAQLAADINELAERPTPKTPEMSEVDSAVKVIEVATRYIHRFKTRTPIDGRAEAIGILKDKWGALGVTGITKTATNPGLNHAQRLEFMAILNANMAAADGAAVGNA